MSPRILLLLLPAVLIGSLLQAALWVPGYETQGQRSPQRLQILIEPSIGDARLLNPTLNADTASSRVTGLIFDGLLRVGDSLELEGSLARSFHLSERIYLLDRRRGPELHAFARQLAAELPARLSQDRTGEAKVLAVDVVPAGEEVRTLDGEDGGEFRVRWPERISIHVSKVVPQLHIALSQDAPDRHHRQALVSDGPRQAKSLSPAELEILVPALERNPQIDFELREDIRFHDGHPFDSGDVLFTYRAIMDPRNRSPRRSDFEPVKQLQVSGPHQVTVIYKRLFSPAVNAWTMGILPQHLLEEPPSSPAAAATGSTSITSMRDAAFNRSPVGTGPYAFVEWRSDEFIHLRANPDHHLGTPLPRDYYFRILPDPLTQELEFRAGALDSYPAQPHQAARYRDDPRFQAFSTTLPGYTYVGYNLRREPFSDPRFRRALGMAIDTEAIIRYVLFDEGTRVTGPFANISPWYNHDVSPLEYSPEKAAALLAELGYRHDSQGHLAKDGKRLEFTLITNNGNARRKSVSTIIQREWQRLGIKCNVQLFEWAVFLKDYINPGDFDAVVLGWRLGLDPDLYQLWHSSQTTPNRLNFVGYIDHQSDVLIEQIRREYDLEQQRLLSHALHARIAQLQPYTFLFAPRSTQVLDRKIVMRLPGGSHEAVRPGGAGDIFHHMSRWQKLAHAPD